MTVVLKGGDAYRDSGIVRADVRLHNGEVVDVGTFKASSSDVEVDCSGLVVSPGFVDLHTHLREPPVGAESIETGSKAAVLGGYTAICAMPNTTPACDSPQSVQAVQSRGAAVGLVDVIPIGAITKGRAGQTVGPLSAMASAGVRMFSDDGDSVPTAGLMYRAMQIAADLDLVIIDHAEDSSMRSGHMHHGSVAGGLGVAGIPAEAEEICVLRDLVLARLTGAKIHIAHMTSAESVKAVRIAKADGVSVTCEVTPHHLALTDEDVATLNPDFKVAPPLRDMQHVEALKQACADGVVDAIATDHAPHSIDEKSKTFEMAPCGMLGLQTAFAVCMLELVGTGLLTLERLIELMSINPARIAGLPDHGNYVEPGTVANLTVFDPNSNWTFDRESIVSGGARNTPFHNRKMLGQVTHTIFHGHFKVRDCRLTQESQ